MPRTRTPRPARRRVALAIAFACAAVVTTGCSGGDDTVASDRNAAMRATGTPSPGLTPSKDPPRDSREVSGEGYSLSAPAAFQRSDKTSSNGEPLLALKRTSSVPAVPTGIAVLREPNPKQDVVEQSYALELTKKALTGSKVTRSDVTWPNSQRAVLVQWTEQERADDEIVDVETWQLNVQVDENLILVVVGIAPAADFPTSGIAEAMATFRPDGGLA